MKRSVLAKLMTLCGRLVMCAAVRLLRDQRASWAQAMQAEMEAIDDERETLAFAWGCFCAAAGDTLGRFRMGPAPVHQAGVLSCSFVVVLGCVFMHGAGAPSHYVGMNFLSLAVALAVFHLLPLRRLQWDELLRARITFAAGALLLAVSLGGAPAQASQWVQLGPISLNMTWLLLPALLVSSEVRHQTRARPSVLCGLSMACGALVLQADPVLSGLAAAVIALQAWYCRSTALTLIALTAAGASLLLVSSWQAPEAVPHVDQVLLSSFHHGTAIALSLALLQVLPLWPALRHREARMHGLVWGLFALLALPGWLPSPLVGFSGSLVVGYLLSLALIPGQSSQQPDSSRTTALSHRPRGPTGMPRSDPT